MIPPLPNNFIPVPKNLNLFRKKIILGKKKIYLSTKVCSCIQKFLPVYQHLYLCTKICTWVQKFVPGYTFSLTPYCVCYRPLAGNELIVAGQRAEKT
jgi:hypothetical protein